MFDLNVNGLTAFTDGEVLFINPKDRSYTIVIKTDEVNVVKTDEIVVIDNQEVIVHKEEITFGSRLLLMKTKHNGQLAPEDEPETEERFDRHDTYEIAGMVVGCWDDHTVVICNENEPKCSLLIANSPAGPILTTTAGAAIPVPDDDIEISLSAD